MPRQAIVLAGGFGTRLKGVVDDLPKPMAPVSGVPFLEFVLEQLARNNFDLVVLSVGFLHQKISDYFGDRFKEMKLVYEVEDKPLFTGGAVLVSTRHLSASRYFVVNGDTFFDIDFDKLETQHKNTKAELTIAVKRLEDFERYGTVEFNDDGRVTGFCEKQPLREGFINGGIYLVNKSLLENSGLSGRFSLEKDFFEKRFMDVKMQAFKSEDYFIDIGIPEDYERAQYELERFKD